jgi:hypothetical protein
MANHPDHSNVKKWEMPSNYFGSAWRGYYSAGVGQSRDSSYEIVKED